MVSLDRGKILRIRKYITIMREQRRKKTCFLSLRRDKTETRPRDYLSGFHAQLNAMKSILLINVKMQTIVGILKFISMINTTYQRL